MAADATAAMPSRAAQIGAAAGFTLLYLLFCLQHVVIGSGLDSGISLGSTALRLVAVGAALAFVISDRGVAPGLRAPFAAICACLCVLAVSAALSEHRLIAVKFGVRYATQLLMLWCVLHTVVSYPQLRGAMGRALVLALWIGLLIGFGHRLGIDGVARLGLMFHGPDPLRYAPRLIGLYEHPATFGAIAVVVAVMAVQLWTERAIGMLSLVAAIAGAALALILTEARNPVVPLLALAAIVTLTRRGRQRRLALAALALSAALVALMIWRRYDELTSASRESLATMFSLGRTYIWQGAFEAWMQHPWWGLGPGVFQYLTPDFTGGRFLRGELHAHDLVLGILSETGLMGLIAMAALAIVIARPGWTGRHGAAGRRWVLIWLVVVTGLGLFDFYLPFHGFSLHVAVAAALVFAGPAAPPMEELNPMSLDQPAAAAEQRS